MGVGQQVVGIRNDDFKVLDEHPYTLDDETILSSGSDRGIEEFYSLLHRLLLQQVT